MTEQQKKDFRIINGNSLEILDNFEPNSVDAIVTDPPYELGFMGKQWDASGIAYNVELWKKALRVLKPGGYLLAFGGSRTFHRIACAIEDAGFEIRDTIMWLYGSGFPKSHNVGIDIDKLNGVESEIVGLKKQNGAKFKLTQELIDNGGFNDASRQEFEVKKANNEWNGWGTALKPAFEPIIMARKPIEDSVAKNVLKYGVGAINIDECRIDTTDIRGGGYENREEGSKGTLGWVTQKKEFTGGRFPANVLHDGSDEVVKDMPNNKGTNPSELGSYGFCFDEGQRDSKPMAHGYEDEGSVSRYFYCAKASKKDRDEGLGKDFDEKQNIFMATHNGTGTVSKGMERFATQPKKNFHPTVKPVELMQYLVRLVSPRGATIVDIFNGSGTTGKAVAFENRERNCGYKYIGIELDPEYCKISESRIDYALNKYEYDVIEEKKENEKKGIIDLFDFDWGE